MNMCYVQCYLRLVNKLIMSAGKLLIVQLTHCREGILVSVQSAVLLLAIQISASCPTDPRREYKFSALMHLWLQCHTG